MESQRRSEPWSLVAAWRAFAGGWNAFFHTPCDGRIVALVRTVFAALVLIHFAVLYPDLALWFTDAGYLPREQAEQVASPYAWSLLFLVPDTLPAVQVCFWLAVASAGLLLVGWFPRLAALSLFVWLVSFQNRNVLILDGEDTLMRMMAFCLIWMPATARSSSWRTPAATASGPPGPAGLPAAGPAVPGWPLRLWQLEIAAMFLSTGLLKWSGEAWVHGAALYYVSRLDEHFGRFAVPAWMFDTPWVVALVTWSVLAAETLVPLLIWFRETRLACLAVVLVFHLANEWTMNLFLFHWLMICGWLAFLVPEDFRWLRRRGNPGP